MESERRRRKVRSDMSMDIPEWFSYVVWDYSDPSFPVMKGLKKNTPKELVKKFKEDQKRYAKALEDGILM